MKVNSTSNIPMTGISPVIKQRVIDFIPKVTASSSDNFQKMNKVAQKIVSPENNRLILGAAAILTQPLIDLYNKKVDEDTRKFSAARTVAKIIAGTSVGYFVRFACIKSIETFSKTSAEITKNMRFAKYRSLFLPSDLNLIESMVTYKKSLGTILGLFVMLFTNFLLDAPLTKFLTNKFIAHIHKNDPEFHENEEVKHE